MVVGEEALDKQTTRATLQGYIHVLATPAATMLVGEAAEGGSPPAAERGGPSELAVCGESALRTVRATGGTSKLRFAGLIWRHWRAGGVTPGGLARGGGPGGGARPRGGGRRAPRGPPRYPWRCSWENP